MTAWPEPDRPHLPPRPPRQRRPPGTPRPRPSRDDQWVWFGFVFSLALILGFAGYWTYWFGLTAPPTTVGSDGTGEAGAGVGIPDGKGPVPHSTVGSLVLLGLLVALVVGVAIWIFWGMRDHRPSLDQLPEAERERRRQAAALLRQVEPPVSEQEALEQLRPPWLLGDEAADDGAGDAGGPGLGVG
ncbi:MAG TPA: hypothetical protein VF320_07890 [Acidimicrobiales bacterium]